MALSEHAARLAAAAITAGIIVGVLFFGGVIWVAVHFIVKFW